MVLSCKTGEILRASSVGRGNRRHHNHREVEMRKRRWVGLMLMLVVPGLLLIVSCAPEAVKPEPVMTDSEREILAQKAAEEARKDELEKQRALEEQRLREEREQQ